MLRLIVTTLLLLSANAWSAIMLGSSQDLPFNQVDSKVLAVANQVGEHSLMIVKGHNFDDRARIVILRFDDKRSGGYHSRLNIERPVRPGPFELHIPLSGLKTPDKRVFEWSSWHKFYLFADANQDKVKVSFVSVEDRTPFSEQTLGFDLGTGESPVMPGMSKIVIGYPGLDGKHLRARHTASGNALTTDGIEGIEQLQLTVPNGRWQVVLWHRMQGEWENLPRQMQQKILVQGKGVFERNLSEKQWLAQDYLQGQSQEAVVDGDLWALHGERAFERSEAEVTVSDGLLRIQMQGATTHDNYLAGVLVTPVALQGADKKKFFNVLRQRFEQQWPVVNSPDKEVEQGGQLSIRRVEFQPRWQENIPRKTAQQPVIVAKGQSAIIDFEIYSGGSDEKVRLAWDFYDVQGRKVDMAVAARQGFWRYQRPLGASSEIHLDADELQAFDQQTEIRLPEKLSRRINWVVKPQSNLSAGYFAAELKVIKDGQLLAVERFDLALLNVSLPPLNQAVGIYHEKPVHWGWFDKYKDLANSQLACDYQYLGQLGLTAVSPPLSTPPYVADSKGFQQTLKGYIADLQLYHQQFGKAALDYTTIKRFEQYYQGDKRRLMTHLSQLRLQIMSNGLPLPQFAMVDEMLALNDRQLADFSASVADVRTAIPEAIIVGQLNKPQNRQLLGLLDSVLINYGFGVDVDIIRSIQQQGKSVWLYNMPNPRLAAGFYLWRSGAQGYLQWHGRMPTGEPYFPLDGREADFQMLYPSMTVCAVNPDINASLLALSEGISDRRWLSWLQRSARTADKAKSLLQRIRSQIPTNWDKTQAISHMQVQQWRESIMALAVDLQSTKRGRYAKP